MAVEMKERLDEQVEEHDEELFDHGEDSAPEEADDEARFTFAHDFRVAANQLISEYETHRHLAEARILYLFRRFGWNRKGRPVLGTAHVLDEQQRFLTDYDLKVIVNEEAWEAADEARQRAYADHLLCYFVRADDDKDGNPVWKKAEPDVMEFHGVYRRHGAWQESLQRFVEAGRRGEVERAQGKLFDEQEPQEDAHAGFNDAPPQDDVEASTPSYLPEAPSDNVRDVPLGGPAFEMVTGDYEGTGLTLYQCEASMDMQQLAEAAYQANLPKCVIDLIRTVTRGDAAVQTTNLYHYRGPGHDPVIIRITNAMRESWLRQLQGA